jgi:hypothetical protein
VWLALIVLAVTLASAFAAARVDVPPPLRSAIVIRSAGYERGVAGRRGQVVLAVVVGKSDPSTEDGAAMLAVLGKLLGETTIAGRSAQVVRVTHESVPKTVEELKRHRAEVVYFAVGLEPIIRSIPMRADDVSRILVCANGADVGHGCTIGVELKDRKPLLVLNLAQANSAGLRFDPGLLRLAKIVR